jgi:hypothetical protein
MAITASRLNRLERDSRACLVCEDWPDEVAVLIRTVVVNSRDEIRQDRPAGDSEGQSGNCPSCGRKPPRVTRVRVEHARVTP